MSVFRTTEFGRFRKVDRDGVLAWVLECPGCGVWGQLDDDQMHGRVSVDHAADGCPGGYHETHDYAAAIEAAAATGGCGIGALTDCPRGLNIRSPPGRAPFDRATKRPSSLR